MKRKVSGKKQVMVGKTVRARFSAGVLKPLEPLKLREGEEVTVNILSVPSHPNFAAFSRSAGGWKGTIDAEKLIRDIYESRLIFTRPEPRL